MSDFSHDDSRDSLVPSDELMVVSLLTKEEKNALARDIGTQRENARTYLVKGTIRLAGLWLVLSAGMTAISAFHPNANTDAIQDWSKDNLVLVLALGGPVLGFYFGRQGRSDSDEL